MKQLLHARGHPTIRGHSRYPRAVKTSPIAVRGPGVTLTAPVGAVAGRTCSHGMISCSRRRARARAIPDSPSGFRGFDSRTDSQVCALVRGERAGGAVGVEEGEKNVRRRRRERE